MDNRILLFVAILISEISFAQSPEYINYQAVVRNTIGIVANTAVSVSIRISDGNNSYTYAPSSNPSTNSYGLLNLEIGPISGSPQNIDWSSGNVTITSSIHGITGPAVSVRSVPYALYANQVQNYPLSGDINQVLQWDGNEWKAVDVNSLGISGATGTTEAIGTTGTTRATDTTGSTETIKINLNNKS